MSRQVASAAAQASHEPYSQAIVSGGLVFCSGTLGIDPATGKPLNLPRIRPSRRS